MRARIVIAAAAAVAAPCAAFGDQAPDLAAYDCTRLDDGRTERGDALARAGFEIVSVGRFGRPNVVMADPVSKTRANCLMVEGRAR